MKECPNCRALNDPKSLNCTFCGYVFGTKKRRRKTTTNYQQANSNFSWTQQSTSQKSGGRSSGGIFDGTNLSWSNNRNLGRADTNNFEGDIEDGMMEGNDPSNRKTLVIPKENAKIIGICVKCGGNLFDTSYQHESIIFLENNGIKDNFHKYIKHGMMTLCPICFNRKLNEMKQR